MFFSFAKIHLFFEMVIKTFLVSLFDPFDYTFILIIYMFVQIFVRDNFSSRRCEIFLVRIFVLYRDVVSSVSGGNFKVVYRPGCFLGVCRDHGPHSDPVLPQERIRAAV